MGGVGVAREGADAVHNVVNGVVKMFVPGADGRRVTGFLFAGDVLGLAEGDEVAAQAITPVIAYRWDGDDLERLLRGDGNLQFCFLSKLCRDLQNEQRYATSLAEMSAVQRLVRFLFDVLDRHRAHPSGTRFIDLPMSRSEIANYVGLTLESVSRKFSALERGRILKFHGRQRVEILDPAALERLLTAD